MEKQNKEQQKKLLTEIMEADQKNGLYDHIGDTNKKVTAVEWLFDKLKSHFEHDGDLLEGVIMTVDQAKQMEKEQTINAWRNGDNDSMYPPQELDRQAEEYYNETYGKE